MTVDARYIERRSEIEVYFDRTAIDAWRKFASNEKIGRIRETVRAGRNEMRARVLASLPDDLAGWRILDAGCGAGQLSIELAGRGADVVGVDLAPEIVRFARQRVVEAGPLKGTVILHAGDMLAVEHGRFDAVVAMDSIIHYSPEDGIAAIAQLAHRTRSRILFTFAPRTPLLRLMHAVGKLLPRGSRSPRIEIVSREAIERLIDAQSGLYSWRVAKNARVDSGFYVSQLMELRRP